MVLPMAAEKGCLSACPRLLGMHSVKITSFPSFFHLVSYAPAPVGLFTLIGSSSLSLILPNYFQSTLKAEHTQRNGMIFTPTLNTGGKRHHNECSQRDDRILGQSIPRLGRRSRKPRLHKAPSLQELFCVTAIM